MHALIDALRLGEAIGKIADGSVDAEQAIGDYVKEMLERGNRAVTLSEEAIVTSRNSINPAWLPFSRRVTKLAQAASV